MLNTTITIAALGKEARNRAIFDIYDGPINYNTFVRCVFNKRMEEKTLFKNSINKPITYR